MKETLEQMITGLCNYCDITDLSEITPEDDSEIVAMLRDITVQQQKELLNYQKYSELYALRLDFNR